MKKQQTADNVMTVFAVLPTLWKMNEEPGTKKRAFKYNAVEPVPCNEKATMDCEFWKYTNLYSPYIPCSFCVALGLMVRLSNICLQVSWEIC